MWHVSMELQSRNTIEAPAAGGDQDNSLTSPQQTLPPEEQPTAQAYLKLMCAGFSFYYAGTNDGTLGPLLPYMLQRYNVSTGLVTVMYSTPFLLNDVILISDT